MIMVVLFGAILLLGRRNLLERSRVRRRLPTITARSQARRPRLTA